MKFFVDDRQISSRSGMQEDLLTRETQFKKKRTANMKTISRMHALPKLH